MPMKVILLPPYHHIKGIYPSESVKDKPTWYLNNKSFYDVSKGKIFRQSL